MTLSQNRAKSVYDYLVSNGIGAERLAFKGYGETMPIADNNTPEGRAKNRRTEFKVMSK
jgi:outer membrane protein OmpA-like peptidoglycan-associated protein